MDLRVLGAAVLELALLAVFGGLLMMANSRGDWLKRQADRFPPGRCQRFVSQAAGALSPVAAVLVLGSVVGVCWFVSTHADLVSGAVGP